MDKQQARERGNTGAQRAAEKAERVSPGWIDEAVRYVDRFTRHNLLGMTGQFTIEQAREWAESMGLEKPTNGRAWGQVTRRAKSEKIIHPVPGVFLATAASNGSSKQAYTGAAFEGDLSYWFECRARELIRDAAARDAASCGDHHRSDRRADRPRRA